MDPCKTLPIFKAAYEERLALLGFSTVQRAVKTIELLERMKNRTYNQLKKQNRHICDEDINTLTNLILEQLKDLIINTDDQLIINHCKEALYANTNTNPLHFKLFVKYFSKLKLRALQTAAAQEVGEVQRKHIEEKYDSLEYTAFRSDLGWSFSEVIYGFIKLSVIALFSFLGYRIAAQEDTQKKMEVAMLEGGTALLSLSSVLYAIDARNNYYNIQPEGDVEILNEELLNSTFNAALTTVLASQQTQKEARHNLYEIFPLLKSATESPASTSESSTSQASNAADVRKLKTKTRGKADKKIEQAKSTSNTSQLPINQTMVLEDGTKVQTKPTGDVVVIAKETGKSTYLKLYTTNQFFFFNRSQVAEFYSEKIPQETVNVETDKLYSEIDRVRFIPPAEKSLKTHPGSSFFGCDGKIRISNCDNRFGTKLREPTEKERQFGINGQIHVPNKISNHAKNKR